MTDSQLHILLIEDDDTDARATMRALSEAPSGFEPFVVDHVKTLEDGLGHLAACSVDAILVDLGLPDSRGGVNSVEQLRKSDQRTPIVVLTGNTDEENALRALKAGAQDYVCKREFAGSLLFRATVYAIERQKIERENARLQKRIEQISKQESLTMLAAEIGADFGHVVEVLAANLSYAETHPLAPGAFAKELATMRSAIGLAARLSDQLLVYAGERQSWLTPVDLVAEVVKAEAGFGDLLHENLEVRLNIDPATSRVLADTEQLQRLLLSLVSNADEAIAGKAGFVEVSVTLDEATDPAELGLAPGTSVAAGDIVTLRVRDSGPGVEESALGHIFEPYYTSRSEGRGLGLAVVMGIAQLHGAGISVSNEPGAGLSVAIHFPALSNDYKAKGEWTPTQPE